MAAKVCQIDVRAELDYRVFCVLGDGESMEGSIWEALHFASMYKLDNLVAVVDVNRLGQSQATSLQHDVETYRKRLEAFGFNTYIVDGHDVESLCKTFHDASTVTGCPTAIIAKTLKGKGIPGADGPSQMALEDLAMFRAIPGCVVFYPTDAVSTERAVELAAQTEGMCFIRISRPVSPIIYDNEEVFRIGKAKVIRKSNNDQVTIVGAGVTITEATIAADILKEQGVNVRIVDPFTIKPIDSATLLESARATGGRVITVEDHYPEGAPDVEELEEAVVGIAAVFLPDLQAPVNVAPREMYAADLGEYIILQRLDESELEDQIPSRRPVLQDINEPIRYTLVEDSSIRGKDLLIDSYGYRYTLKVDKR